MALTAIYTSDATSWQLSLPPKALAANNGSLQSYTSVAKIADNGSSGQYNKKEIDAISRKNFTVYPNLASDLLTINNPKDVCLTLSLYNAQGQQIIHGNLTPGENTFSVAHLPAGLYFGAIKMNQTIQIIKVVIEQ